MHPLFPELIGRRFIPPLEENISESWGVPLQKKGTE
jgi:hypothetical protein